MAGTPSHTDRDLVTSYSEMSVGDVEAIGAHCQMPFCGQLDFLPFRCESCKGKFCLDHRSETAHSCNNAGAWSQRRAQLERQHPTSSPPSNTTSSPSAPKPTILTHEQQCSEPSCKTLINTPLVTGVHCDKCRRNYCLKHRFTDEHNCANLTPLGVRTPTGPTTRERGLAALDRLRAWGAAKKTSLASSASTSSGSSSTSTAAKPKKSTSASASSVAAIAALKRTAKGDEKTPPEKRIYLYVEAASETLTSKIPKGTFYYSVDYTVGRVLDLAAKQLQVSNLNNRSDSEEDRLRVFHVEGGKLLEFGTKLGVSGVKTGHTVVLLRGVGPGMAAAP